MPTSRSSKPKVLITIGDPSGIGPEVTLKALASPKVRGLADFFIVGSSFVVKRTARDLGLKIFHDVMDVDNVIPRSFSYGRPDPAFGLASVQYIDKALELLRKRCRGAIVTAPINKSSICAAGFRGFEGHTEYLAGITGTKEFAMMFIGEKLKITLVTRHIPLKDVPKKITLDKIVTAIKLTDIYLKKFFRIKNPRIGISGLNPHAGENGAFGDEEARVIAPAIKKASRRVKRIYGPVPPDVIFNAALDGKYDAVVAMYHDQALIPFKLLYFATGINLTVGLPFIRTSPDHGTAFDIAGKGIADPSSMIEAIRLACVLARPRRSGS
ncbi:MAG: 4-hydroxythreonine-4-phosphate dehydrogenase PdxA [Candidatus Omnitrophica bacterium]|nr:4-hydroxythreonine-4-phosphate dehydrogenase PdxA [Candidatus Omnitrophota bacterium]